MQNKKILTLTILIFVVAFGFLLGSVSAAELQEHDFNGQFKLNVPGNYWMANAGADGHQYEDGHGIIIQYLTLNDIKGGTFTDYLTSHGLKDGKVDGKFTVFQKDGKYVVVANSSEEMYIITDKNLDEAKAIAASADLGTSASIDVSNKTSSPTNTSATGNMEKVNVGDVLTINAPKGSEFNNGTYDGFWRVYSAVGCDAVVYYTNDESANTTIDDAYYDKFINNVTSQNGVNSSKNGNVTVVEGIQNIDGTNAAYTHGDNAMVIVVSNDLNLVKEMAKSVEFK
ncbi:hypothetical protein [uncultured Methanobrevibacter sp.]|uniref:hypothetical protein n=1 Tax=uncultured Methanobrevibacter sp. TaxID=253161 RepID=UPI0025FE47DF|nr:hypothetical protein [uncultured Methanobrevibacter sp.]